MVSEIAMPKTVYCCFTRTTLFTKLFTCFYDQTYRLLSHHQVSLLLFYKNYIFYYNVYCYYCGVFIEKYVHTKFRLDWLLCE